MDEPCAKLTEDGGIKARIGAFQGQGILPVDAPADGGGGLPIRQAFDELENQHQGQACGGFRGLPGWRKEGGKLAILLERAQCIAELEAQRAFGKGGVGYTDRF